MANNKPEIAVGIGCVVLFGFMFYKQTMLQAEIKRLKAMVEESQTQRFVTAKMNDLLSGQSVPPETEPEQPECPPEPQYQPPPRNIARIDSNLDRSGSKSSLVRPETAEPEPFLSRPDPVVVEDPIDSATQRKIDQLVATRLASRSTASV